MYLLRTFGLRRVSDQDDPDFGVCNLLYPCGQCQLEDERMKQRQAFEKKEFLRLTEKNRLSQLFIQQELVGGGCGGSGQAVKLYGISSAWFKQWEHFVQLKQCPQKHQIPGPIQNYAICNQQMLKNKIYQLNKSK